MNVVNLIFPHQLFKDNALFDLDGEYYLIEENLFFTQYNFHQQKIAFHRATMKSYEQYLQQKGFQVKYIEANHTHADIRKLISFLAKENASQINLIDPVDDWLLRRITSAAAKKNIKIRLLQSPMYLNTPADLAEFFNPNKRTYFQTAFYKQQRISKKILVQGLDEPTGGKWSFDEENRKKFPKGKAAVQVNLPKANPYTKEAVGYTKAHFGKNIGSLNQDLHYPINFEDSKKWLDDFLNTRFNEFGDYEDAIVQREMLLNHSLLTPMLNVGLLTPPQVINAALTHAGKHQTPINSVEGFIRQIIGWREFIRGVYITKGRQERTKNFWGFTRKLPNSFYDGTTGIIPFDETIKKVLKTGYCHHIERLMILGNFMLLCEIDPNDVYQWFMELFIDAYDWVMVPNVYGMSQFADGGILATKPYISGSNYLIKMSDYPKGKWQEVWDALFWRFMDKQRDFFLKNPRLGMLIRTYDKWPEEKKANVYQIAEEFLNNLK
ncbi:cryptochrome/photolyase family protein [Pedobacter sandarakinus]|uniref:cryptochrome/photolyase family protein n=1 Tax=Pedobacter sandarakinus TaxID=353156 RepID=UPI002245CB90|nr:cryptochrome/photolyase family protein [Pedobacter sandarakinus]MCX2575382.1 cryptochrome/photolyase family protein [Pedobacter sandarakinus]